MLLRVSELAVGSGQDLLMTGMPQGSSGPGALEDGIDFWDISQRTAQPSKEKQRILQLERGCGGPLLIHHPSQLHQGLRRDRLIGL